MPEGTTFVVHLENLVPRFDYVVTPVLRRRAIAPLQFSGYKNQQSARSEEQKDCEAAATLNDAIDKFDKLEAESEVPEAVKAGTDALKSADGQPGCHILVGTLKNLVDTTDRISRQAFVVPRGFDLTVVVTRTGPDATLESWSIPYTGRDAGQWVTTYGFSFLTTWPWGEANESFVAEETEDEGEFAVTRDASRERLRFIPTIFYTWHSDQAVPVLGDDFSYGFSGGLGFDLSNPVVAATFALIYRRNLTLHLGAAAAQVYQLRGRYSEGDIVGNLTPEELRESNYRINPFVSLSFTFATSPFDSRDKVDEGNSTGGDETGTGNDEEGGAP